MTERFSLGSPPPRPLCFRVDAGHSGVPLQGSAPTCTDRPLDADGVHEAFAPPRPANIYLPERYEPNYAYPLVIWMHRDGHSERELSALMPRISTQNHVGLSVRGFVPRPGRRGGRDAGFGWDSQSDSIARFLPGFWQTLSHLRSLCRVHPERVYLAGCGRGAEFAVRMLWQWPERFAGAVALDGEFSRCPTTQVNHSALSGRRLLLSNTAPDLSSGLAQLTPAARMFHAAGLSVTTQSYEAPAGIPRPLLSKIDSWILSAIGTAIIA